MGSLQQRVLLTVANLFLQDVTVNFLLVILLASSILGFAHVQFGTGNANTFVDSVRQLYFCLIICGVGGGGRILLCHSPLGKSVKKSFF
jgi:hypothetical protein